MVAVFAELFINKLIDFVRMHKNWPDLRNNLLKRAVEKLFAIAFHFTSFAIPFRCIDDS